MNDFPPSNIGEYFRWIMPGDDMVIAIQNNTDMLIQVQGKEEEEDILSPHTSQEVLLQGSTVEISTVEAKEASDCIIIRSSLP